MAKVIGFDPKLLHTTKCRKCAAIIEYSKSELQEFVHHDYGGGHDIVTYIVCPNCGNEVHTS